MHPSVEAVVQPSPKPAQRDRVPVHRVSLGELESEGLRVAARLREPT